MNPKRLAKRTCQADRPGRRSPIALLSRWLPPLLLATCAQWVLASDGTLLLVSGRVEIVRPAAGGASTTLAPATGDAVAAGDSITTGDDGRVQIRFNDGSVISLQPKTRFGIDEFAFDANSQRGFFRLVHGALRTVTGAIGKRNTDDYRLITPTATVGIRGTEYVAEETVCDPDCSPGRSAGLRVAVSEGRVVVTNRADSVEVPAGSAVHATQPDGPIRATEERPVLSSAAMPRRLAGASGAGGLQNSRSGAARPSEPPLGRPAAGGMEIALARIPTDVGSRNRERTGAGIIGTAADAIAGRETGRTVGVGSNGTGSGGGAGSSGSGSSGTGSSGTGSNGSGSSGSGSSGSGSSGSGSSGTGSSGTGSSGTGSGETGSRGQTGPDPGGTHPTIPGLALVPDGSYESSLLGLWLLQTPRIQGLLSSAGSHVTLDGQRQLLSLGVCPSTRCLTRGSATVAQSGADAIVAWGRWIDGNAHSSAGGVDTSHPLSPTAGMHYLLGIPTLTMPTSGTASYTFLGATGATFSDGSGAPGSFTGSAVVQFGSGKTTRVALDAQVLFVGDATYRFETTGGLSNPAASNITMTGTNTFRGSLGVQTGQPTSALGCSAANACKADVTGGFLGPDAARLGLGYTISPPGNTGIAINGVGVLRREP
jgi:hypothetical protein